MDREVCRWMPPVPQGIRVKDRQVHLDHQSKVPLEADDRSKLAGTSKDHSVKTSKGVEKANWYEFGGLYDRFLCLSSEYGANQGMYHQPGRNQICAMERDF